jgi:hypothetical protein
MTPSRSGHVAAVAEAYRYPPKACRERTESLPRTHPLRDVMVGEGRPSMACGPELAKSVDGRPSRPLSAWGDGASAAALVLRQVPGRHSGPPPTSGDRKIHRRGLIPGVSVRHQHRHRHVPEQVSGDATHDHLPRPRMSITADHQQIGSDVGGIVQQRIGWRQPVGHDRPRC